MSILKRTVFYDNSGGFIRFWDWALVTTTLGTMAEPFVVNNRHTLNTSIINFDPTDEISRIDEIRAMPRNLEQLVLSSHHGMMGGETMPRLGP